MKPRLIIVVGTTPDYVSRIQQEERIKQLLFLLDRKYADSGELTATENSGFIFSNLDNYSETQERLEKHLKINGRKPCFACFDCETLYLTSRLAEYFNCSFPSSEAVLNARNKFLSGRLWTKNGIPSPACETASSFEQTLEIYKGYNENVVLKPLTGSGSELVFHCVEESEIFNAVRIIENQLKKRKNNPLFTPIMDPVSGEMIDPCSLWLVEEFIPGPEYSCDFFMDNDSVFILRETGKIKEAYPFGTVSGYIVPPAYAQSIAREDIETAVMNAARALGFTWGYFMADFIIDENRISMIELTPRPGGDSLPDLIKASTGKDILNTYLNIITGDSGPLEIFPEPSGNFASVHFYSEKQGVISDMDSGEITTDPGTRFLLLKKHKGDTVSLPPDDYDNRLLGYCIVSSGVETFSLDMCRELQRKLKVTYLTPN